MEGQARMNSSASEPRIQETEPSMDILPPNSPAQQRHEQILILSERINNHIREIQQLKDDLTQLYQQRTNLWTQNLDTLLEHLESRFGTTSFITLRIRELLSDFTPRGNPHRPSIMPLREDKHPRDTWQQTRLFLQHHNANALLPLAKTLFPDSATDDAAAAQSGYDMVMESRDFERRVERYYPSGEVEQRYGVVTGLLEKWMAGVLVDRQQLMVMLRFGLARVEWMGDGVEMRMLMGHVEYVLDHRGNVAGDDGRASGDVYGLLRKRIDEREGGR